MILANLDDEVREDLLVAMLSIYNHRLYFEACLLQIFPCLLVYSLVLGLYFLPVEILPEAGGTGDNDAIAPSEKAAINTDDEGAAILTVLFGVLIGRGAGVWFSWSCRIFLPVVPAFVCRRGNPGRVPFANFESDMA
jgi:hypothetical protein